MLIFIFGVVVGFCAGLVLCAVLAQAREADEYLRGWHECRRFYGLEPPTETVEEIIQQMQRDLLAV